MGRVKTKDKRQMTKDDRQKTNDEKEKQMFQKGYKIPFQNRARGYKTKKQQETGTERDKNIKRDLKDRERK